MKAFISWFLRLENFEKPWKSLYSVLRKRVHECTWNMLKPVTEWNERIVIEFEGFVLKCTVVVLMSWFEGQAYKSDQIPWLMSYCQLIHWCLDLKVKLVRSDPRVEELLSIDTLMSWFELKVKLVRSDPRVKEFQDTFPLSAELFFKYQRAVHKDPPEKCTERRVGLRTSRMGCFQVSSDHFSICHYQSLNWLFRVEFLENDVYLLQFSAMTMQCSRTNHSDLTERAF